MSYILEALRKSERQRQIVTVHGGGMLYPAMVEHPRSASVSLWLGSAGLTAVMLALLVWLWPRSPGAAQMATQMATQMGAQMGAQVASQMGPQVASHVAAQVSAELPGQATGLAEASVAQPSAAGSVGYPRPAPPIPVVPAPRRPAATADAAVTTPVSRSVSRPTQAVAAKAVASASPGNQAVAVLPMDHDPTNSMVESGKNAANGETWQAELPTIAIAGYIRDEQGTSLAMINEKLVREGEEVAPNLRLEKILGDGSIFNYKGYRFRR